MYFNKEIPNIQNNTFYVLGFFFSIRRDSILGYFVNKKNKLKGIGATFRNNVHDKYFFCTEFHDDYILGLHGLLHNLFDKKGNKYFSDDQIEQIIEWEKIDDKKRGTYNVYIRMLIASWLDTTGVYVNDFVYVGNVSALGHSLEKHAFWVRNFLKKEGEDNLVSVSVKTRKNNFFDLGFKPNFDYKMSFISKNIHDIFNSLYTGANNSYIILLQKTLKIFFSTISEKDKIMFQNNNIFINNLLKEKI